MNRILHIIDSLSVGGAEKLLVRTINGLPDYEHHVMVLKDPIPLQKEITVPHKFINLKCTSFRDIFSKIKTARRYIKEHHINLVHSHLYEANLLARLSVPRSVVLINSIHAIS